MSTSDRTAAATRTGLAGEEIALGSRTIIAADAYHAITSDRPYRAARSQAEASRSRPTAREPNSTRPSPTVLVGHLYGQRQAGLVGL